MPGRKRIVGRTVITGSLVLLALLLLGLATSSGWLYPRLDEHGLVV
jgi:hypothetical protein